MPLDWSWYLPFLSYICWRLTAGHLFFPQDSHDVPHNPPGVSPGPHFLWPSGHTRLVVPLMNPSDLDLNAFPVCPILTFISRELLPVFKLLSLHLSQEKKYKREKTPQFSLSAIMYFSTPPKLETIIKSLHISLCFIIKSIQICFDSLLACAHLLMRKTCGLGTYRGGW